MCQHHYSAHDDWTNQTPETDPGITGSPCLSTNLHHQHYHNDSNDENEVTVKTFDKIDFLLMHE